MNDENGNELRKGDEVNVPAPIDGDIHSNEFTGTIDSFRNECAVVMDGDGDCFSIEPERLTLTDDELKNRQEELNKTMDKCRDENF